MLLSRPFSFYKNNNTIPVIKYMIDMNDPTAEQIMAHILRGVVL